MKFGTLIQGLEPDEVVRIVTSEPIGTDVLINTDDLGGPHYICKPFTQELDWAVTSTNLLIKQFVHKNRGGLYEYERY